MSELIRWQDKDLSEYYNADEVDVVLAEKDKEITELRRNLQDQCISRPVKIQEADVVADLNRQIESLRTRLIEQTARSVLTETQLRHQKYKRCLDKSAYWLAVSYQCVDDKHRQQAKRHRKKWLELAKKFKEAKR